jgi:P4 family phage/plasmid primase-like protien
MTSRVVLKSQSHCLSTTTPAAAAVAPTPSKVGAVKTEDNGLKNISPIIYRDMSEPTITITRGLFSSDKDCVDVPVAEVEAYLTKHTNCYERLLPTERNASVFNRAYIDIDGYAGEMSETEFDELCETIRGCLTFGIMHPMAMMEASQYGSTKKGLNKLSFRINFTKKHGSKGAIKEFVVKEMYPLITTLLGDYINVVLGKAHDGMSRYISIDPNVYNANGRKMRLWNTSKDGENRPNKLVGDATVEDTLHTYIPDDSEALPEPVELVIASKVKKEKTDTSSTDTDPKETIEDKCVDVELLTKVIMGLDPKKHNEYEDWIKIGLICFNEGLPVSVWDAFSKKSSDYNPLACAAKYKTFTKGKLTQASLWKWLKEENNALFRELCPHRTDFWALIGNYNHAETARYFYNLKPDAYAFHESLGWYALLPSNAWKRYEKTPSGLMTDIWLTLKKVNKEHWDLLDPSKEEDQARAKQCATFAKQIGSKGFVDGVVAFLPANYNDESLNKKMDETRNLFAFQDRVVDLDEDNEVRNIKPTDYVCLHTGYDYPVLPSNPEIRKEIKKLLFSIWEDWEVVEYVMKVLALQLHGKKRYEEFYIWTGRGGNGKGVITELIKRVFGDYFHSIPHDCITKRSDKKDAPNPPMAKSKGKRFVQCQEPEADDKLQIGTIKELTGGDEITARQLYHDPVVFVPQFGLFLQCNTIPKLNKLDGGIKRRMVIIYFPFQFVDRPYESHHRAIDHNLKDKITKSSEWRDEFILMLLDAYKKTKELVKPKFITDYTDEYLAENDAVRGWLDENYTINCDVNDKHYKLPAEELRKQFIAMTDTPPFDMPAAKFKTLMEMNGVPQKRESNAFTGFDWDTPVPKIWNEVPRKAGSYYLGIRVKAATPVE